MNDSDERLSVNRNQSIDVFVGVSTMTLLESIYPRKRTTTSNKVQVAVNTRPVDGEN